MYQVICIVNWQNRNAGNEAHEKLIPRILDRWEEIAPSGAQAFVARCSDTKSAFTAIFPSPDGIADDPERNRFRRVVGAVIRDWSADTKLEIVEGKIVASRVRE